MGKVGEGTVGVVVEDGLSVPQGLGGEGVSSVGRVKRLENRKKGGGSPSALSLSRALSAVFLALLLSLLAPYLL